MAIYFKKTILKNADFILDLQKQCFKNDFLEYKDYETSPYCETLEDLQHDITTNQHFTIFSEENIVGAFEIKEKHNSQHLYKIFISQHEKSPHCETFEYIQTDITTNQHFTMISEENIVGAFEIKEKHNSQQLYKIFISQHEQNNGIGKLTMKMIFEKFTNKNKWTVYTP